MKIKLHTAERTIKLRDSKQSAEHLFRRLNIRRLVKSARESPDTQTVEADAAETTVSLTPIVLQSSSPAPYSTAPPIRRKKQDRNIYPGYVIRTVHW